MTLDRINRKLGWAVLISGITLAVLAGTFALMTGNATVVLVVGFGVVAIQAGRVALRENAPTTATSKKRIRELVAA